MSRPSLAVAVFLVTCVGCVHAPQVAGRYMYEVTCEAEVARFDTIERKKTGTYGLATRPGVAGLIPVSESVGAQGLVIYDAATGRSVKTLDEPRLAALYYHGMSPTGVALYQTPWSDELIDLGMTFPAEAVVVSPAAEFAGPAVFFADR